MVTEAFTTLLISQAGRADELIQVYNLETGGSLGSRRFRIARFLRISREYQGFLKMEDERNLHGVLPKQPDSEDDDTMAESGTE